MHVKARDKRIKELNRLPASTADEHVRIKGLQPEVAVTIRHIVAVLRAATSLTQVATAHPSWRVHQHKGKRPCPWSIDVTGNYRLIFFYDYSTHEISGMYYDDPH